MGRLILVTVASILLFTPVCLARTWFVTPDGTGDAPTIQAAVDSARGGDTVLLDNGTFTGTGNRDILIGSKALNIISISGNPELCIIDCQGGPDGNNHRAFDIRAGGGKFTLDGLTITNGHHESGGAMVISGYLDYRVLEFFNCRFLENFALAGGAVCIAHPDVDYYFRNCIFVRNSAADCGGAFYCWWHFAYGSLYMEDCTFIGNSATYGAVGFSLDTGESEEGGNYLIRCTVVNNTGLDYLFCAIDDGFLMENCIVAYNQGRIVDVYRPECTDAYGNSDTLWEEAIAGRRGNFSACPSFCNAFAEPFDLHLCDESPCAPGNHPDGIDCGLIGGWPVGCSCGPSRTEGTTWGAIKAMYR